MSRLTARTYDTHDVTSMTSVPEGRELPWMANATLAPDDGWASVQDALEAGGLTWGVAKRNLRTMDGTLVPDFQAVVRTDTKAVLGVVGHKFVPVQNVDALEPVNALVADSGGRIEAAGALNGGKRVYAAIRLPGDFSVPGDPTRITPWMIVANGHDGSLALSVNVLEHVYRCTNILVALATVAAWRIRLIHRPGIEVRYQAAHATIAAVNRYLDESMELAAELGAKRITEGTARAIIQAAFPIRADRTDPDKPKPRPSAFDGAWALYQASPTIPDSIRPTAWGAIQAVTEWVDHGTAWRGGATQSAEDRRANALMFGGRADDQKARAVEAALGAPRRRIRQAVVQ